MGILTKEYVLVFRDTSTSHVHIMGYLCVLRNHLQCPEVLPAEQHHLLASSLPRHSRSISTSLGSLHISRALPQPIRVPFVITSAPVTAQINPRLPQILLAASTATSFIPWSISVSLPVSVSITVTISFSFPFAILVNAPSRVTHCRPSIIAPGPLFNRRHSSWWIAPTPAASRIGT